MNKDLERFIELEKKSMVEGITDLEYIEDEQLESKLNEKLESYPTLKEKAEKLDNLIMVYSENGVEKGRIKFEEFEKQEQQIKQLKEMNEWLKQYNINTLDDLQRVFLGFPQISEKSEKYDKVLKALEQSGDLAIQTIMELEKNHG